MEEDNKPQKPVFVHTHRHVDSEGLRIQQTYKVGNEIKVRLFCSFDIDERIKKEALAVRAYHEQQK